MLTLQYVVLSPVGLLQYNFSGHQQLKIPKTKGVTMSSLWQITKSQRRFFEKNDFTNHLSCMNDLWLLRIKPRNMLLQLAFFSHLYEQQALGFMKIFVFTHYAINVTLQHSSQPFPLTIVSYRKDRAVCHLCWCLFGFFCIIKTRRKKRLRRKMSR